MILRSARGDTSSSIWPDIVFVLSEKRSDWLVLKAEWLLGSEMQSDWLVLKSRVIGWFWKAEWLVGSEKRSDWLGSESRVIGWFWKAEWLVGSEKQSDWSVLKSRVIGWVLKAECLFRWPAEKSFWLLKAYTGACGGLTGRISCICWGEEEGGKAAILDWKTLCFPPGQINRVSAVRYTHSLSLSLGTQIKRLRKTEMK